MFYIKTKLLYFIWKCKKLSDILSEKLRIFFKNSLILQIKWLTASILIEYSLLRLVNMKWINVIQYWKQNLEELFRYIFTPSMEKRIISSCKKRLKNESVSITVYLKTHHTASFWFMHICSFIPFCVQWWDSLNLWLMLLRVK